MNESESFQLASFGAGCFWGVEERFRQTNGVISTQVGFMGGQGKNPSYAEVCAGLTGHAEVVQLRFDPKQLSFKELLQVFWDCHDPTTLNRQAYDMGDQYRSVIFFHDETQQQLARASMDVLAASGHYKNAIVTQLLPSVVFHLAEDYHQHYIAKRNRR